MGIDHQVLISIEEAHFFERHAHRLRGHVTKIFGGQALPARFS
jgi:hypothetical protein